jgi:hypothetical protein
VDDTSDAPIFRVELRVIAPPGTSALALTPAIEQPLKEAGFIVLGFTAHREHEGAPSDPSVLP